MKKLLMILALLGQVGFIVPSEDDGFSAKRKKIEEPISEIDISNRSQEEIDALDAAKALLELSSIDNQGSATLTSFNEPSSAQLVSSAGNYQCSICGKTASSMSNLKKHQVVHAEDRPFICDIDGCGLAFKRSGNLKGHQVVVHTKNRPFRCDVEGCDYAGRNHFELKRHEKEHMVEKRFECKKCGESFSQKNNLNAHEKNCIIVDEINDDNVEYTCKECKKNCKLKSNLVQHLNRTKHSSDQLQEIQSNYVKLPDGSGYECVMCKLIFPSVSSVNLHNKSVHHPSIMHAGEKPFKCNKCESSFKRQPQLSDHVQTAHKGRCYQCSTCGYTSLDRSNIRRHLKRNAHEAIIVVNKKPEDQSVGQKNDRSLFSEDNKNNDKKEQDDDEDESDDELVIDDRDEQDNDEQDDE